MRPLATDPRKPHRRLRPVPCLLGTGQGGEPLFVPPLPDRRSALLGLHEGYGHQGEPDRSRRGRVDRAHPQRRAAQSGRRADHGRRRAPVARAGDGVLPAGEVQDSRVAHSREPARAGRPVVRILPTRASHRLQQGQGKAGRSADLREPGRAQVEGARVHALGHQHLQPLADGRAHRPPRGAEGRGLGEGGARESRPGSQGRRYRPAQGGRGRAVRRHDLEPVLLCPPRALGEARRAQDRRKARPGDAEPAELGHAREHLGRRGAEERAEPRGGRSLPRVPGERRGAALLRRRQQRVACRRKRQGRQPGAECPGRLQAGSASTSRSSGATSPPRRRSTTGWPGSSASRRKGAAAARPPR